jgi:hypothetical protein
MHFGKHRRLPNWCQEESNIVAGALRQSRHKMSGGNIFF